MLVRPLAALFTLLVSLPATAQPALWEVKSAQSTVYLFGTVHLLPSDTDWRYPALDKALAASDSLTIELTDDDPAHMQALVMKYGLDPSHPLSAELTAAENTTLAKAAQTAGVPGGEQTLEMMRPWLAALTLGMAPLIKAGFDPAHGVDKLLQAQMIKAGKPVNGLETSEQQIGFLANLPQPLQLDFLRDTLHDVDKDSSELTGLITAWKNGDTDGIAHLEDDDVRKQSPELYKTLIVDRNKAWATKIAALLQHPGTVLIAVGAAHLAGPDSVQAQLKALGIQTQRE
ncbi:TraB/GumN family protein [Rhodanobacter sp. BL-MT-08]